MVDIRTFLLCWGVSVVFTEAPWLKPLRTLMQALLARTLLPSEARREPAMAKRYLLAGCWPRRRKLYDLALYFLGCRQCQVGQAAFLYGVLIQGAPALNALGLALVCIALAWFADVGLHALGLLGRCAQCGKASIPAKAKKVKRK